MLDRRRDAESLLMAFWRAQMTRHCWGEFAASLQELGLPMGRQLDAMCRGTVLEPAFGSCPNKEQRLSSRSWNAGTAVSEPDSAVENVAQLKVTSGAAALQAWSEIDHET